MGAGRGKTRRVSSSGKPVDRAATLKYIAGLDLDIYLVGGSVRDEFAGYESSDMDFIMLGMDEDEALAALCKHGKAEVTGESFGVIRFKPRALRGTELEIALPRMERSTGPAHRDFEVEHGAHVTLDDDLIRRDFTVNAMAENVNTGDFIDPYGGREDLAAKRLKLVHADAFKEDPLRIMRGFQLISRFDLDPDEATRAAMIETAPLLEHIPGERKAAEMEKLLKGSNRAKALYMMRDLGVLPHVMPRLAESVGVEQNFHHAYDVFTHIAEVTQAVKGEDLLLLWAALLHDVGKPGARFLGDDGVYHFYADPKDPKALTHEQLGEDLAKEELERLHLPNRDIATVALLVREHGFPVEEPTPRRARRLLSRVGEENIGRLLQLKRADQLGSGMIENEERKTRLADIDRLGELVQAELDAAHAFKLSDLEVSGNDLIEAGIPKGPRIGRVLNHLLESTIEDPSLNERESLLSSALAFDQEKTS